MVNEHILTIRTIEIGLGSITWVLPEVRHILKHKEANTKRWGGCGLINSKYINCFICMSSVNAWNVVVVVVRAQPK